MKYIALLLLLLSSFMLVAVDFSPLELTFQGQPGSLPAGWRFRNDKAGRNSGIIDSVRFESFNVMRVVAPADTTASLQYCPSSFPKGGRIQLIVWLRAAGGRLPATLFLLGDNYRWKAEKRFEVGKEWKACSLSADVPAQVERDAFWFRIDVPAGGELLVGKVTLTHLPENAGNIRVEFTTPLRGIPPDWEFRYAKPGPETGVTDEFSFESVPSVMRLVGPVKNSVAFQYRALPFPSGGRIKLTAWVRSEQGTIPFRLFLLGDNYSWKVERTFQAGPRWEAYSIIGSVPEKPRQNSFWLRLDLAAGNRLLLGRIEVEFLPEENRSRRSGNMVVNDDFRFGAWRWNRYYGTKLSAGQLAASLRQPVFTEETVVLPEGVCLYSQPEFYLPGREYEIRARMRSADGKPARITLYLITGNWKVFKRNFELTPEYRDYSFTAGMPHSRFNRFYARLDTQAGMAEIDRVQVAEGKPGRWLPEPELCAGPAGPTLFDQGVPGELLLRLLQNREKPVAGNLKFRIVDAFGRIVREGLLPFAARHDQILRYPLPDPERRGVFRVMLGDAGEFRYAVLRNLKGCRFTSNPFGGHYDPSGEQKLEVFDRYFPIVDSINRFFSPRDLEAVRHPIFQKQLADSPYRNVMRMPYVEAFQPGAACELTPENEAAFLRQVVDTVTACRGKLYGLEFFNEPHLWRITTGPDAGKRTMPPEKLAHLYKLAYPAVKQIDPAMRVFGPVGGLGFDRYFEAFAAAGGAKAVDALDFHGYNNDPDAENSAEQIGRLLRLFPLPAYNTETYYGFQDHRIRNSDDESGRSYFRANELEHASVMSSMMLHHAVHNVKFCNFMPRYLLDGVSGERMFPLAAAAAINAGIEFLGNAGKGREIPLDESLRCFLFEQAEGGPLGTLKVIGELTGGTVLPETVRAFDLFGNELSGRILKLSGPLVYLRFPAGSDAEKILRSLRFTGLGDPVSIQLSMSGRHSLLLRCRNRRADSLKAEIRFVGLPSGITVEPAAMTVELAPGAERQETIALAGGAVGEKCRFKVQVKTGEGTVTQEFSFAPIFVHYSRTLSFENVPFLSLAGDHLSCPFTPGLTWKGREDLCARFAAVWNEHGLKLRIVVDDDHFIAPESGEYAWRADSLQLYFDMKRDATVESDRARRNLVDDLVYNIGRLNDGRSIAYLSMAGGNRYLGDANRTTGIDDAVRVDSFLGRRGNVTYEIFLPEEALYLVRFQPGTRMGFSLLVNDNDGAGRKTGLTLASPGTQPHRNAAGYRDLIFIQ